jgi:hypothetical protein
MPMNKPVKPKATTTAAKKMSRSMAKPKPRPTKPVEKPKAPRGSKSATQVGNDNQRELYNAYRGQVKPNFNLIDKSQKVSKGQVAKAKSDGASASKVAKLQSKRNSQRAGGVTPKRMMQRAKKK